jgi:hypothetical protein
VGDAVGSGSAEGVGLGTPEATTAVDVGAELALL